MSDAILVLNAGSSSIKFEVFDRAGDQLENRAEGQVEGIGTQPRFKARDADGETLHEDQWQESGSGGHKLALSKLSAWLNGFLGSTKLYAVGHRVVHGGADFSAPVRITDEILAQLEAYVPLAPLHQPHNLAGIKAVAETMPEVPQVGCFDTAFHRPNPLVAEQFGLPQKYYEQGVRRYGFHGLSYEYIAARLPEVAPDIARGRVVVAHLGNGASMCAIYDGKSVDTTMGFTALDGLPMGTRCGALDPGVLLYLLQQEGMDGKQLEELLYKQSGLLGISGVSNDMRTLLESDEEGAAQAIDYFVYRIGRELGALASALGGLDALVFTAGIGERAVPIRERVCRNAAWLGIEFDPDANTLHGPCISTEKSRVSAWVIPTDEERMIAMHTIRVLG
jgi:acetate kinase